MENMSCASNRGTVQTTTSFRRKNAIRARLLQMPAEEVVIVAGLTFGRSLIGQMPESNGSEYRAALRRLLDRYRRERSEATSDQEKAELDRLIGKTNAKLVEATK